MELTDEDLDIFEEAGKEAAIVLQKAIDNEIAWEMIKQYHNDWHEFSVPWTSKIREEDWNEICAWAIEQFGLPGERYKTHPDVNAMKFLFRDAKDYEWMVLKWA